MVLMVMWCSFEISSKSIKRTYVVFFFDLCYFHFIACRRGYTYTFVCVCVYMYVDLKERWGYFLFLTQMHGYRSIDTHCYVCTYIHTAGWKNKKKKGDTTGWVWNCSSVSVDISSCSYVYVYIYANYSIWGIAQPTSEPYRTLKANSACDKAASRRGKKKQRKRKREKRNTHRNTPY